MKNRMINKNERKFFFDNLNRHLQGQEIELEVDGLDVGAQIEEDWAQLQGLAYDPKNDILYVNTPEFEHSIVKPEEVISVQDDMMVNAIYIKDSDGHVQSMKFRRPLMLEAPARHEHF
jgi:hypothetical protein